MVFECEFCEKTFTQPQDLSKHLNQSQECNALWKLSFLRGTRHSVSQISRLFASHLQYPGQETAPNKRQRSNDDSQDEEAEASEDDDNNLPNNPEDFDEDDNLFPIPEDHDVESEESVAISEEDTDSSEDGEDLQPDESILDDFTEYCREAESKYMDLLPKERTAIKLLQALRDTKASLDTYEEVMKWHFMTTGVMKPGQTLADIRSYVGRNTLFKKLRERYNLAGKCTQVQKVVLPCSKSKVNMVWNDTRAVVQSLLTDPRIQDDDYLFFDPNNPFAPPPENLDYIADLNTGLSYTATYKDLIDDPTTQILLPTPLYIDGAACGQFTHLPITALKITLGIFTRKARDKPHFWRTLGYVPQVLSAKSQGKTMLVESLHHDAIREYEMMEEDEGVDVKTSSRDKAQDFHYMLSVLLEDLVELQKRGFYFDFYYRGTVYKRVLFKMFVPFIKCDTKEADALCGAKSGPNCKQLCRYCDCLTDDADKPLLKFKHKTQPQIQRLVERQDVQALGAMSQHFLKNALYKVRFGSHNTRNVHGACPIEMLHQLLLGMFKYCKEMFFEQIGPTSICARDINALAKEYGKLLARQSQRDLPRTAFATVLDAGRKQGKEYTGILLIIAIILRSTKGRYLLHRSSGKNFNKVWLIKDWILLVETLIEWEAWLKLDRMEKKHITRAKKKHKYLMYLIKKIGRRTKGKGLKLVKFHSILHMAEDILFFGVPLEVDTGSNESGHKPTKKAAKLTQRIEEKFEQQTDRRLEETFLLELADQEMQGRPLWDYWSGFDHEEGEEIPAEADPTTGGAEISCYFDEDTGRNEFQMRSKMQDKDKILLETELLAFIMGLQDLVGAFPVLTEHKRSGVIFRCHPNYRGTGTWRDWVKIDWGDDGELPAKICGFVDLSNLIEDGDNISYGGLDSLEPVVYAIVESGYFDQDEARLAMSDLFLPITLEVNISTNEKGEAVHSSIYYLADVGAFLDPLCVVPNIGGECNHYFAVYPRATWAEKFIGWLERAHVDEVISDDEDDS